MSGNCFWHVRIAKSMLSDHIRWITCHYIKRSCPKNLSSFLNITLYDLNIVLQMIISDTASGHICTLFLNLKTCKVFPICFGFKQDRDNSRSCSQIQSSLTLFYFCKAGKKNCIHPKTEFIRILYHIISALKIIYTFIIFYQLISHLIWNLLFYLPDFQVLLILFQRL